MPILLIKPNICLKEILEGLNNMYFDSSDQANDYKKAILYDSFFKERIIKLKYN